MARTVLSHDVVKGMVVCGLLLCGAHTTYAQNEVILISQERVIRAAVSGKPARERVATDVGAFFGHETVQNTTTICGTPPAPSFCVEFPTAINEARQSSLILTPAEGGVIIQADGAVAGREFSESAISSLRSVFAVTTPVSYSLSAEAHGNITISLASENGAVFGHANGTGQASGSGLLEPGIYALTIAAGGKPSDYDFRLTVTPRVDSTEFIFCWVGLDERTYAASQQIKGAVTLGVNRSVRPGDAVRTRPVEVKMWLRTPDAHIVPLKNEGADGSLQLPDGTFTYPLELFAAGSDPAPGIYEVACRFSDPDTGKTFDEHTFPFEVK
jgi:hypothetical protein